MVRFARARDTVAAGCYVHGETISKLWINMNKDHAPKEVIAALRRPFPLNDKLERKSNKMAEIARQHHENLQKDNLPRNDTTYKTQTKRVLSHIKSHISPTQKQDLVEKVTRKEVQEAMHTLKCSKAAGLDGILHELWLSLELAPDDSQEEENVGFDSAEALTIVFNDIQEYGMAPGTDLRLAMPSLQKGRQN